ncbi:replication initiator protein A [uncultured Tyzzerella sp.]|uniref:replication initiator protein A n=1 Tax=uncultured Tyzzerella sp. TaxID=2321398 RepID=UPI0029433801|nr:replication initiator protein A [uncultured Tyzzerella sp.]
MTKIKFEDLNSLVYYQVPKWLMDLLIENKISLGAFKTYVLMYERTRLSAKNNWIDEDGDVYIKYSYDELMEDLKCNSRTTVSNNLKDLEKLDLIDKIKCFNSSNIYYLKVWSTEDCTSIENSTDSSTENCTISSTEDCTNSSTETLYASNNNFKKNYTSKNYLKRNTSTSEKSSKIEPKKEKTKNKLTTEEILKQVETENISLELKNKIKEFIKYRKEIKKTIQTYTVISKILNQIGTKYIDENHLILSIEDSMANQYQGIFPIKLNKLIRPVQQETPAMRMLRAMKGGVENDRY